MGSFRTTVVWDPMVPAVSLPAGSPRQSIRGGAGLVFNSSTSGSSGCPHWLKSCLRNLLSVLYVDQPALNQGGPAGACLPQHLYFVRTQACEARLGSQKKRFLSLCALVSRMKDESSTEQKVTNRF